MPGRVKREALATLAEMRAERDRRWAYELKLEGFPHRNRHLTHYVLEGREVIAAPFMDWAMWFEHVGRGRIVAQTKCRGRLVSTVFLGLDHNWAETGDPLIFETMVFADVEPGSEPLFQCRWSTYDEAEQGHAYTLALTEAGGPWVSPSDTGSDG